PDSATNGFALSPDGHRLASDRGLGGASEDIWMLDVDRGASGRITFDPQFDILPIWSPDGQHIVFSSNRNGQMNLYDKLVGAGTQSEQPLIESDQTKFASDWSADGRFLLFMSRDRKTADDIWAMPLSGDRKPFAVVKTEFEERGGQFSP